MDTRKIGTFEGRDVHEVTLKSDTGMRIDLMNWGGVIRDWQVMAPEGPRGIVLGFDSFEPYPDNSPYFGALVGRVANRIRGASFKMGDELIQLDANENGNMLHGGSKGFGNVVWQMEPDSTANSVKLSLVSPDGDMGFPGRVEVEAIYTLKGNRLRLDFHARPDRVTPISLVQHIYFNLGLTDTVLDHSVQLPFAVARTEADAQLLMTGAIFPTAGSKYDFRQSRTLRDEKGDPIDYDLNFALDQMRDLKDPIAIATGEDGALTLKLWSDQPGLQFYDGVWTKVGVPGHGGRAYGKHSGLCFEDQMYPDAVNQRHFPSILCSPDRPYRHWCEFEIASA